MVNGDLRDQVRENWRSMTGGTVNDAVVGTGRNGVVRDDGFDDEEDFDDEDEDDE